jgi:hypothetical protein
MGEKLCGPLREAIAASAMSVDRKGVEIVK